MQIIFSKVSFLIKFDACGLSHRHLFISFPNTFLWLHPNIEEKRIPLNNNIVWGKKSRVIKDLLINDSFFLNQVTLNTKEPNSLILSTR